MSWVFTVIHTLGILASIKGLIWSFLNINTGSHQSSTLICSFFLMSLGFCDCGEQGMMSSDSDLNFYCCKNKPNCHKKKGLRSDSDHTWVLTWLQQRSVEVISIVGCLCSAMLAADWSSRDNRHYFVNVAFQKRSERTGVSGECWIQWELSWMLVQQSEGQQFKSPVYECVNFILCIFDSDNSDTLGRQQIGPWNKQSSCWKYYVMWLGHKCIAFFM